MAGRASASFRFGPHLIHESVIFFKSKFSYAFVNIKPVVPGHVLVSSLRPAARFADLNEDEVADLFISTQKVSNVIQEHFKSTSLSIAIQDGPDAGQTVQHVHVHILPRIRGDFENNDDIYRKLEEHDKGPEKERNVRTPAEMESEACQLRSYFHKESS